MQSWIELAVFSGKAFILVIAIAVVLILFFALLAKVRHSKPILSVENLNRKYEDMARILKESVLEGKALKQERKQIKKKEKAERKQTIDRKRIYVVEFSGDIRASGLNNLREEITSILTVARPGTDEVVVNVESPGGMVHSYGLAAAQLVRIRENGLQLTVCVDKVAASGGYMMACTAHKILAAPFAIVGSIGVVAQLPNFHRLLKKHDVDYEEITAGEFKRTVSLFGEITDKGKRKFLDQIEDTHGLFKGFVATYRPQLNLQTVATGEYWFGQRAKDMGLVDEIISSDEYLFRQRENTHIYRIETHTRKSWSEKLTENVASLGTVALDRLLNRTNESRFL